MRRDSLRRGATALFPTNKQWCRFLYKRITSPKRVFCPTPIRQRLLSLQVPSHVEVFPLRGLKGAAFRHAVEGWDECGFRRWGELPGQDPVYS